MDIESSIHTILLILAQLPPFDCISHGTDCLGCVPYFPSCENFSKLYATFKDALNGTIEIHGFSYLYAFLYTRRSLAKSFVVASLSILEKFAS